MQRSAPHPSPAQPSVPATSELSARSPRSNSSETDAVSPAVTSTTRSQEGGFKAHSLTEGGDAGASSSAVQSARGESGNAADCCPQQRSSVTRNPELAMGSQIVLEMRHCVPKRHTVVLQKRVHLKPRVQSEEAPYLTLRQRIRTVALNSERFERLPREIRPPPFESGQDVIGQFECDLHRHLILNGSRIARHRRPAGARSARRAEKNSGGALITRVSGIAQFPG